MAEVQAQAYEYVVRGTGYFPFDMLRHDKAWPKSEIEIASINPYGGQARQVKLIGLREPTEARWQSFGWKIVEFDRTSITVKTMPKVRARR